MILCECDVICRVKQKVSATAFLQTVVLAKTECVQCATANFARTWPILALSSMVDYGRISKGSLKINHSQTERYRVWHPRY